MDGRRFVPTFQVAADVGELSDGESGNELGELLPSWFGAGAGQPGTAQYVEMVPGVPHSQMRPASSPGEAWLRPAAETS